LRREREREREIVLLHGKMEHKRWGDSLSFYRSPRTPLVKRWKLRKKKKTEFNV
jgi:hypothetical protein